MPNRRSLHRQRFPWARFYDLAYPVRFDELGDVLDDIMATRRQRRGAQSAQAADDELIGDSADTQRIRSLIDRVAPSRASVLITGESGTGKEVIARRIHARSGRDGPFVAINCGAIPDHLLESELFGHERGAFTGAVSARRGRFEQADGGTLFLDEIGDMPSAMQVKLLRVLQERTVERVGGATGVPIDIRVITATHRDLQQRIEDGTFREDLYYRLSVFPIEISPLRERPEDIPPLTEEMIGRARRNLGVGISLDDAAMRLLNEYAWPGNVRELANLVERLAVVKPGAVIGVADLPWPLRPTTTRELAGRELAAESDAENDASPTLPKDGIDLKRYLSDVERRAIEAALDDAGGVVKKAADRLGMGRTTLVEKIRRYEIAH